MNDEASVLRLPKVSAIKPDGISNRFINISLTAYKIPISKNDNPVLTK